MKIKRVFILILLVFILISSSLIYSINDQIKPQVSSIALIEADNASSKVVQRAIESLELDTKELMSCIYDEKGKVIGINYDTDKINKIMNEGLEAAEISLTAASLGIKDPNTNVIYYDKGIIYSVHLGYFSGMAFLSNVGPRINVRFRVMHASSGEIQVTTTPYGVNNTLVKIELVIITQMVVITPFLMETQPMESRIPLVIQIVQGEIPQMMLEKIA